MIDTNFEIWGKNSLAVMVEIVDLGLRAVIDSFEIYIIRGGSIPTFLLQDFRTIFF